MRALICAVVVIAASLSATAQPTTFQNGDLYFISNAYPQTGGFTGDAVVYVDPTTWTHLPINETTEITGRGSYDPFRDRLILTGQLTTPNLIAMDALGAFTTLIPTGDAPAALTAPTGDGRIYYWGGNVFGYLDSTNAQHTLLDETGLSQLGMLGISAIIYDPGTDCLFTTDTTDSNLVTITKLTLSTDGSQVTLRTTSTVDVSTTFQRAVGMNRGPGGSIYIQIDDNSNSLNPRMQLLNPVTMLTSTFASSGGRIVAGDVAGAYSSLAGVSVILESLGNRFHIYAQGSSGTGTIVDSGVSGGGSGEVAQFIEVLGAPIPCPADLTGDGTVDGADLGILLGNWGSPGISDLNSDGTTDGADLGLLLGAWGPC